MTQQRSILFLVMILAFCMVHGTASANLFLPCSPGIPCAQDQSPPSNSENQACDTQFQSQMIARALVQSERDSTHGQTFITKPDSVLEYTCFDRMLAGSVQHAASLFSTGQRNPWQNQSGPLAGHLEELVYKALVNYTNLNYGHGFVGDRFPPLDSTLYPPSFASSFVCQHMARVWANVQCSNAMGDTEFNNYTIRGLIENDPRSFNNASCSLGTNIDDNLLAASLNPTFAGVDRMRAFHSALEDCGAPIPTGALFEKISGEVGTAGRIENEQRTIHRDYVCTAPGCYFDGASCVRQ